MKVVGVIPSRFNSSRLPGKPLRLIDGLPLVVHVHRRAKLCPIFDELVVATDAQEIFDTIKSDGGEAIMTSPKHKNGTERMIEVTQHRVADCYVLINGDEILLNPSSIATSVQTLVDHDSDASLLAVKCQREKTISDFKVVLNAKSELMYISRNDIPSWAKTPIHSAVDRLKAYHIMSFKPETLDAYAHMKKTPLDEAEDHEHLRLLENGFRIAVSVVEDKCISLDTEQDIPLILDHLKSDPIYRLIRHR